MRVPDSRSRSPCDIPQAPRAGARLLWAAILAGITLAWLVPDLDRPGVTWDEPEYFASARRIQAWVGDLAAAPSAAIQPDAIGAAWDPPEHDYFNPHPPVYKEGMALTEAVFGSVLGSVAGFRLSSAVLFAVLVAAIVWTVSGVAGIVAGISAGVTLLLMPRVFGHAHLATTDMPLTCLWTIATLAFAGFLRRGGGWRLAVAAVALGLAMGTKFTGWLLPVPLLVWAVLERRWWSWLVLVPCALVVSYAAVPIAWHEPLDVVARLFDESVNRDRMAPFATFYFGTAYPYVVPWHQSIVMTLFTVPVGILSLSLVGAFDSVRSRSILRPEDPCVALARLCLLQIGFFLALMALPSSPNHDGVRLFLPMFPFVAVLGGLGFSRLFGFLRDRIDERGTVLGGLLLGIVFFLPAWWQTNHVSPYYLSYYNELIGGLPGAARAGMEVSYWYDAMTPEFLARVEQELPEGATLGTWPTWKYFEELQAMGRLRSDIRISREWPTQYLLLLARNSTLRPPFLDVYENVQPVLAVELDGVELAGLYAWSMDPEMISPESEGEEQ